MANKELIACILLTFVGCSLGDYCTKTSHHLLLTYSYNVYCPGGCCGPSYNEYCCLSNTGIIVGVVLGIIVILALCVTGIIFLCKRQANRSRLVATPATSAMAHYQHQPGNISAVTTGAQIYTGPGYTADPNLMGNNSAFVSPPNYYAAAYPGPSPYPPGPSPYPPGPSLYPQGPETEQKPPSY